MGLCRPASAEAAAFMIAQRRFVFVIFACQKVHVRGNVIFVMRRGAAAVNAKRIRGRHRSPSLQRSKMS